MNRKEAEDEQLGSTIRENISGAALSGSADEREMFERSETERH